MKIILSNSARIFIGKVAEWLWRMTQAFKRFEQGQPGCCIHLERSAWVRIPPFSIFASPSFSFLESIVIKMDPKGPVAHTLHGTVFLRSKLPGT